MDLCKIYKSTTLQQLYKIITGDSSTLTNKKTFPVTVTQAVFDGKTGNRLDSILTNINSIFVPFDSTIEETRLSISTDYRRKGLIITYKDNSNITWTQRYIGDNITDEYWKDNSNWEAWDFDSLVEDLNNIVENIFGNLENYPELQKTLEKYLTAKAGYKTEVVTSLPTIGNNGTIYLVLNTKSTIETNYYDEYIWVDSLSKYEQLGSFSVNVDLSDYTTKKDFEELQNTVNTLLLKDLSPYIEITASSPVEFTSSSASVSTTIKMRTKSSSSLTSDFTNPIINYNINGTTGTSNGNSYTASTSVTSPKNITISASGTAKYNSATVNFANVSKTVSFCKRSYISYIEATSVENAASIWTNANAKTSFVKASPAGTYSNITATAPAYLVIAIPKNGNVSAVNTITQKGTTMNASLTFSTINDKSGNYTLYICNTKHNAGTYSFIIT